MSPITKQLLALVEKGSVEQRCAALLVLGALKLQNSQVLKSVGTALHDSNPVLKNYALRYFEEAEAGRGIPLLLDLFEDPQKEIQERAVRLLSRAGRAAVQAVVQRAPSASRLWQLNAAGVLCAVRGKEAFRGLLWMLLSGTDDFNKAVCDLVIPAVREMDREEHELLYEEVMAFTARLNVNEHRPAVIAAIRLLAQVGRPQARRWLFRFLALEYGPTLRSHALVALLHCLRKENLRKEEYSKLFSVLEEEEFSDAVRLTVELLDAHALAEEARPLISRLLQSPHETVQKFALHKMGEFNSPATVRTLVQQLGDPDYKRRDIAARSLYKIPEARAALLKELLACDNPSKAWTIAELLPSYNGKWRADTLDALWKRLQAAIAAKDRIQTSFMHVLKTASEDYAYRQLAAHGARLIKARKYKNALAFLTPLKEFSEFKPEHKLQLALAQLKVHASLLNPGSRRQEPAVDLLSDLYHTSAYPLLEDLKKEKSLAPDELFYLGFTLVERPGEERLLGKGLLEHLAARFPRNKCGKSAKNKLRLLNG